MHIPDGYLSPQTCIPLYAAMVPIWGMAARRAQNSLRSRHLPLLAMGAAFSFVIMLFNIPAPGGTSGHAVGSALVAILLGPWAACVAISLALVIQAFLFGDGGITALAANCFTMAVVMPFVGHYTFRLIAGATPVTAGRRRVAGFVAGYLALNAAALYTALLLGVQPILASAADGHPLYAPYPLAVAVPAMALGHLLLFGVIEGVATALVIGYLQKADPQLLTVAGGDGEARPGTMRKLRWGIGMLVIVSPLGLVAQVIGKGGTAWGEWSSEEVARLIGYVPDGMERLAGLWRAPFAGYAPVASPGPAMTFLSYLLSALIGVAAIALGIRLLGRLAAPKGQK
jgi:cobalt/nickel transport system permease protein